MKVLRAIGGFFAKIGRWIANTAWIQPLLIVGGIFAVIFSIPYIKTAIENAQIDNTDYDYEYYKSFSLNLEEGNRADKLLGYLENEEFDKINTRSIIKKERDLAFEKFLILLKNNQKQYLKEYKQSKPWTEFFYDDEYVPRIKQLNDTLTEKMEKQNKLKTYEEPIINKEEIENDTKEVEELYKKMINIPCPIHPHKRENIKLEDLFNFLE